MSFEVFPSIEQEEFSAFLGVLYLVIYAFLIMYKALSSVKFEYSVWMCDEYVEVWKGRMFACWEDE